MGKKKAAAKAAEPKSRNNENKKGEGNKAVEKKAPKAKAKWVASPKNKGDQNKEFIPKKEAPVKSGNQKNNDDKENPEIKALREELRERRKNLGMLKSPIRTGYLAILVSRDYAVYIWQFLLSSLVIKLLVIPGVAAWIASKFYLQDLHRAPSSCAQPQDAGSLWILEIYAKEAGWWILLGVLSSVGFGTGLHSGVMFLFPHIMKAVFAAESCQTLNGLVTMYQHPCKLDCSATSGGPEEITFLAIFLRVCGACMLWGIGTAIGELPPYAVSKAARLAGREDEDYQQELEDAKSKSNPISVMKVWTISFTEKYGFWGVLVLSAWPNAAFDMCGMCCGYLLMPFWTFFIATTIGKGFIKVNGQAVFFILLFGKNFFKSVILPIGKSIGGVIALTGMNIEVDIFLSNQRDKIIKVFEKQARYSVEKLFGNSSALDKTKLTELYESFGTPEEIEQIVDRVISGWDANADGKLTKSEIEGAVSSTDNKISLGSMDPKASSWAGMLWELFIIGLVVFFLVSIIDQLTAAKQQELDDETIKQKMKDGKKKK